MPTQITSRQREIVSTARKIIITEGMSNLTVREIANEMNITDAALYKHFSSKNEIIDLLVEDIEETLLLAIKEAAQIGGTSLQKLENVFYSHLIYAEKRKGTSFIVINEVLSIKDKKLQRKMFGVLNKYLKTIKTILREGVQEGLLREELHLDSAAISFFGMVQSMVTFWSLSGYRLVLSRARLDQMFSIYKGGIIAAKHLK